MKVPKSMIQPSAGHQCTPLDYVLMWKKMIVPLDQSTCSPLMLQDMAKMGRLRFRFTAI